jgi:hypothetical protein
MRAKSHRFFMILFPLLLACVKTKTVYFIRHGEKVHPSSKTYQDEDRDLLSSDGYKRAECLANNVFGGSHSQFITPLKIISQPFGRQFHSHRPYDTVVPLSKKLHLPIDDSCDGDQFQCVHKLIINGHEDPVLVSWGHSRIQNLITELGISHSKPYPKHRFDLVWVVDTDAKTCTEMYQDCSIYGLYENGPNGASHLKHLEMKKGTNFHHHDEGVAHHQLKSNLVKPSEPPITFLGTVFNSTIVIISAWIIIAISILLVFFAYNYGYLITNVFYSIIQNDENTNCDKELLFEDGQEIHQISRVNPLDVEAENAHKSLKVFFSNDDHFDTISL